MGPGARVAVYYAPEVEDPLFAAATSWLGRNPQIGAPASQPQIDRIAEVTADPRVYGFHATLKPPMRLVEGARWADLLQAAGALADRTAPFDLPRLEVSDIFGFLALRETEFCPPLQALADACVMQLDRFRAPPSDAELARRRRSNLTAQQDSMLVRWGYPYVFETWFFHMTITARLNDADKRVFMPAAERYFAHAIAEPRRVNDICLFVQDAPGAPFVIQERLTLRG